MNPIVTAVVTVGGNARKSSTLEFPSHSCVGIGGPSNCYPTDQLMRQDSEWFFRRPPGKRRSRPGVRGEVSRDPRDMAKAGLPEAESPEDGNSHPSERYLLPAPCSAMACLQGRRNLRGMERCPMRAIKEMSRTPKSRSDVRQGRTRDQPVGREPQGDGVPVVVVGATTHRGGRESRPQGEGAQVTGYPMAGRYA